MISIIVGSQRTDSQSSKVGHYIEKTLKNVYAYSDVNIINVNQLALPLWSAGEHETYTPWLSASDILKKSSAFVMISPEWDGMASPAIKNFFNYCRSRELFHKPALLIAVSAGQGGSYPIAELRMSSYKNSRVCYLPEHVIVRHVEEVFNHEEAINENDVLIRDRLQYALNIFLCYEKAFKQIDVKSFSDEPCYQSGM